MFSVVHHLPGSPHAYVSQHDLSMVYNGTAPHRTPLCGTTHPRAALHHAACYHIYGTASLHHTNHPMARTTAQPCAAPCSILHYHPAPAHAGAQRGMPPQVPHHMPVSAGTCQCMLAHVSTSPCEPRHGSVLFFSSSLHAGGDVCRCMLCIDILWLRYIPSIYHTEQCGVQYTWSVVSCSMHQAVCYVARTK